MARPFNYGGQAVIEGVMMRGSRSLALAVRHPAGHIVVQTEPLNPAIYRSRISHIPFIRGLVMLWDSLGLGTKALMMSADIAAGDEVSLGGPAGWITVIVGIGLGIGLFIVLPSFLVGLLDAHISSDLLTSLLEGMVRLLLIVGYMWGVGRMPEIQRVFAYHGAEHKTINAFESGADLTLDDVQRFPTAHLRCGTSFLLTLVIVTVVVFAPFSGLPLVWRVASRVLLLPVTAGIAYEFIRLTARLADRPWMRALAAPNLALQRLTTNEPDERMVEVAILALKAVLADEAD